MPTDTPLSIQEYSATGHHALAKLWYESWLSTGLAAASQTTADDLLVRVSEELKGGWVVYVAREGKSLVGFLALKPDENQLDQLFIAPHAQRKGIGRALLSLAKTILSQGMWLRTAVDNVRACAFYETAGFTRESVQPHPKLGHPVAIYRWAP